MEEIKSLIVVVQGFALSGALVKSVFIILDHLSDEDKTIRNRKLRNLFIALVLIETCIVLGIIVQSYYGGGISG